MDPISFTEDELKQFEKEVYSKIAELESEIAELRSIAEGFSKGVHWMKTMRSNRLASGRAAQENETATDRPVSVFDAVLKVLSTFQGNFSSTDIRVAIDSAFPGFMAERDKTALPQAMARLVKAGQVALIERGRGKKPGIFKRVFIVKYPRREGHDNTAERGTGGPTV